MWVYPNSELRCFRACQPSGWWRDLPPLQILYRYNPPVGRPMVAILECDPSVRGDPAVNFRHSHITGSTGCIFPTYRIYHVVGLANQPTIMLTYLASKFPCCSSDHPTTMLSYRTSQPSWSPTRPARFRVAVVFLRQHVFLSNQPEIMLPFSTSQLHTMFSYLINEFCTIQPASNTFNVLSITRYLIFKSDQRTTII